MEQTDPPAMRSEGGSAQRRPPATTIVVDWGTTAFRAWRVGADGGVLDARVDPQGGILAIERGGFEAAFRRRVGDWLATGTGVWLSGMVGSRNGWIEAPYVPVPATLHDLARAAVRLQLDGDIELHFIPGVCQREPTPDVMRGEEVQVVGQAGGTRDALFVLPGTHSKWVRLQDGAIGPFRTYLTGEMYELLVRHSIVGRLIPSGDTRRDAAFGRGVRDALRRRPGGLLHDVFTARSGALLGSLEPAEVADYLSGLLIGHELREEFASMEPRTAAVLVGSSALIARYQRAFAIAGVAVQTGDENAALRGLLALAALSAGAGT